MTGETKPSGARLISAGRGKLYLSSSNVDNLILFDTIHESRGTITSLTEVIDHRRTCRMFMNVLQLLLKRKNETHETNRFEHAQWCHGPFLEEPRALRPSLVAAEKQLSYT